MSCENRPQSHLCRLERKSVGNRRASSRVVWGQSRSKGRRPVRLRRMSVLPQGHGCNHFGPAGGDNCGAKRDESRASVRLGQEMKPANSVGQGGGNSSLSFSRGNKMSFCQALLTSVEP